MKQKIPPANDFFLHPPWRSIALTVLFLVLGVSVLLRCSELGGDRSVQACKAALTLVGMAAAFGLAPVLWSWGAGGFRMLIGVSIGAVLRFLICLTGMTILLRFTSIDPRLLIVFLGFSYGLFLLVETTVSIRLLRTVRWDHLNDERGEHV